jgi:hypothetical protein
MKTAFDFKKFEQRLLEALNKNEKFIRILAEQESAADQAKNMGLTSMGFGRWGKDDKVTHQTKDGKLEPVKEKEPTDKSGDDAEKSADKGKSSEKDKKEKGGDTDKKPEKEKQPAEPEFTRAQAALPRAKLGGRPLRKVPREQLQQVATRIDDLAKMGQDAKEKGEKAPNYNLCQVSIPGTNLFCGDNKGIPRAEMPQFKGNPRPGSEADKLPKDKDGEVDTEEMFKKMLERDGIEVSGPQTVPADQLKATQSELVGVKVAGMSKVLADKNHPAYEKITAPIYVSRDGYVLDGHHRWAAIVAHNASSPDDQIEMQVRVIDEDIEPLVDRSNKFAEEIGIRAKAADTGAAGDGKPAETPKEEPERRKFKWPTPEKGLTRRALDRVKSWTGEVKQEAKEFFTKEVHKGKSPERRTMAQTLRDKTKGAVVDIKKRFKHEKEIFREAGTGIKKFFSGERPSKQEQKALKSVAVKVATTALFAAGTGGAAHGAAAFAKHVLMEFVPHVVGETILVGAGRASLFAGPEDTSDDAMMEKFMEKVIENFENMDIPPEVLEKAIMSYKAEDK